MDKQRIISPFGFFGGKARMASLICSFIDYSTTYYIEPFGGACRTLLNKESRHTVEIYNDSSLGLCAFMNLMSRDDTAHELIERIYETEFSREAFQKALKYRDSFDVPASRQIKNEFITDMKRLFAKYGLVDESCSTRDLFVLLKDLETVKSFLALCTSEDETLFKQSALNYWEVHGQGFDLPDDWGEGITNDYLNDYDLAVATYVIYVQSRDGIGKYWSNAKYKTQEAYIKKMDCLFEVAERMNGVRVPGAEDALIYVRNSIYLNNPDAFFYLDPSYLKEDENAPGEIDYKDLGKTAYKDSYSPQDHETLLLTIRDAKAKILISNYDVTLYNKQLTPDRGWNRYEFPTKTGMGKAGDRDRLEVLWYNY